MLIMENIWQEMKDKNRGVWNLKEKNNRNGKLFFLQESTWNRSEEVGGNSGLYVVKEPLHVSPFQTSWVHFRPHPVGKALETVDGRGLGYLIWDARSSPPSQIHRSPFHHSLVLKSPSSSMKPYTYTKLKTPVFSVKWCYAYLYCMYVYPFLCSSTVLLYLPQSQMS